MDHFDKERIETKRWKPAGRFRKLNRSRPTNPRIAGREWSLTTAGSKSNSVNLQTSEPQRGVTFTPEESRGAIDFNFRACSK
jgi:hypothetical protein